MASFEYESQLRVTPQQLYRYHCSPGAFGRLTPPWERVHVKEADDGIKEGDVRHLLIGPKPFQLAWTAIHEDFQEGRQFVDRQQSGPFQRWKHTHHFDAGPEEGAVLRDSIDYTLPLGLPLSFLVEQKLRPMFRYRHRQTARDLERILSFPGPFSNSGKAKKIALTGASGLLGTALTTFLKVAGHQVLPLQRGYGPSTGEKTIWWPEPDLSVLEGYDAVIHLAGESIAQLWTNSARERIYFSRAEGTKRLCRALADLKNPPSTLISTSATGYYQQQSEVPVDESAPAGDGFLSEVCQAWEAGTEAMEKAGSRVCHLRLGLIISTGGGLLAPQLPAFKLGLGAVFGDGRQMQSVVDIDDVVASIYHLLNRADLSGAFNVTSPHPLTQADFADELARACRRPRFLRIPQTPIRWLLQEQAGLVLAGVAALPIRLTESGFRFSSPTFRDALRHQMSLP